MTELSTCPLCRGLVEDGVCEGVHPTTRADRVEQSFKSWVADFYREKEQEAKNDED